MALTFLDDGYCSRPRSRSIPLGDNLEEDKNQTNYLKSHPDNNKSVLDNQVMNATGNRFCEEGLLASVINPELTCAGMTS